MAQNLVQRYLSTIPPDHFCLVFFFKILYFWSFIADLLRATAKHSYCLHEGVRPFIKPVFPEHVKQINAKFGEKVGYLFTISLDKFCLLFKILHSWFLQFFFPFSLTWDHMGEKKLQTTSPLQVSNRFTPLYSCILLGRVLHQNCSKNCDIPLFGFLSPFYSFWFV